MQRTELAIWGRASRWRSLQWALVEGSKRQEWVTAAEDFSACLGQGSWRNEGRVGKADLAVFSSVRERHESEAVSVLAGGSDVQNPEGK